MGEIFFGRERLSTLFGGSWRQLHAVPGEFIHALALERPILCPRDDAFRKLLVVDGIFGTDVRISMRGEIR